MTFGFEVSCSAEYLESEFLFGASCRNHGLFYLVVDRGPALTVLLRLRGARIAGGSRRLWRAVLILGMDVSFCTDV